MPSFFFTLALDLYRPASVHRRSVVSRLQTYTSAQEVESPTPRDPQSRKGITGSSDLQDLKTEPTNANDWRCDIVSSQRIDMIPASTMSKRGSGGDMANPLAIKGRFEPIDQDEEELGWGVVRLYRDAEETPGLYDDTTSSKAKVGRGVLRKGDGQEPRFQDEDCTMLCILAVPSYLTPSDFLGFVGEKTRDDVSHFRMIKTARSNRYMVLMKFRSGKKAREWRTAWNGKSFDSIEVSSPPTYRDLHIY